MNPLTRRPSRSRYPVADDVLLKRLFGQTHQFTGRPLRAFLMRYPMQRDLSTFSCTLTEQSMLRIREVWALDD